MLNLLSDRGNRCAVLDCYRPQYESSMWCLKHYREFARELPAEAVADTIPMETIMPNRNTVRRFPSAVWTIRGDDTRTCSIWRAAWLWTQVIGVFLGTTILVAAALIWIAK